MGDENLFGKLTEESEAELRFKCPGCGCPATKSRFVLKTIVLNVLFKIIIKLPCSWRPWQVIKGKIDPDGPAGILPEVTGVVGHCFDCGKTKVLTDAEAQVGETANTVIETLRSSIINMLFTKLINLGKQYTGIGFTLRF